MKAKQLAANLVDDYANLEDKTQAHHLILDTLNSVFVEVTEQVARAGRNDHIVYGAYRGGFTKWKAVVREATARAPEVPISDNYFGLFIALQSPELYDMLVNNKVMLGYEPSPKEVAVLTELRTKRRDEAARSAVRDLFRRSFFNILGVV